MDGLETSKLRALIQGLQRDLRYAVLMYYADELSVEEVALVLNQPPTFVEQTLRDFRADVARLLAVRTG